MLAASAPGAGLLPVDHPAVPRALFDLLIGINRWLYRVLIYVALMRDEYPPFRLDQGGHEPDDLEPDHPATTPTLVGTPA